MVLLRGEKKLNHAHKTGLLRVLLKIPTNIPVLFMWDPPLSHPPLPLGRGAEIEPKKTLRG